MEPSVEDGNRLARKVRNLEARLRDMGPTLIAFSGGVDSSYLLAVASKVLGNDVVALMTVSPSTPPHDARQATNVATRLGVSLVTIQHNELDIAEYAANPLNRCYYCKTSLYEVCRHEAARRGLTTIADGVNLDDLADYRPGLHSAQEHGVRHPLVEAKLTKDDVRHASRILGLPTWDKPASPCLSSRIPYGTHITAAMLSGIAQAEEFLRSFGPEELRVRYDGKTARIELAPAAFSTFSSPAMLRRVATTLYSLGMTTVALDLEGYRSGVFNPEPKRHPTTGGLS